MTASRPSLERSPAVRKGRMPEALPRDAMLIAGILLIALALRVALVVGSRHSFAPVFDAGDYDRIAKSLSTGHGFGPPIIPGTSGASAFRTPLWPALLATLYAVVGPTWTVARLGLAVLSVVLVALTGALGWKLAGRRVGLVALLLASVYPPLLLAGYSLNYEVLMGVFVLAAILAGLQWRDAPGSVRWLIAAGVCSGLAVLCRENAGLVLIPVWVFILQRRRTDRGKAVLVRLLIVSGCAAAVVLPWTVRNAVQLGAFVPVSDGVGWTFAGTYNATAQAKIQDPETMFVVPPQDPTDEAKIRALGPRPAEVRVTSTLQSAGIQYLVAHPTYVPEVAAENTIHLFDLGGPNDAAWLSTKIPWPRWLIEVSAYSFYAVSLAAILGLISKRGRAIPKTVWLFPLLWCVTVVFSIAVVQYRSVVEPFGLVLAAVALVSVNDHRRHRSRGDLK